MSRSPVRIAIAVAAVSSAVTALQAETHVVEANGFDFIPADIVVRPGDIVRWEHVSHNHTVTSGSGCVYDNLYFNAPLTGGEPNFEWVVPSDATGVIEYFCVPHCGEPWNMVGTIAIDEGAFVRFAAIDADSVGLTTSTGSLEGSNQLDVAFGDGLAARFQLGLEVDGDAADSLAVLGVTLSGSGSLELRDLVSSTSAFYNEGTIDLHLSDGSYGLFASGDIDSIQVSWSQPAGGMDSGFVGAGDLMLDEINGFGGVSLWSTSRNDIETLWVGSTNGTSSQTIVVFETTGAAVERDLMWVGNVTCADITMPAEGDDSSPASFPVGSSTFDVQSNGFFVIQLNAAADLTCVGDLNGDGEVDGADLATLLGAWGPCF